MMPVMQAVAAGNVTLIKWLLHANGGELRRRLETRQIQGHLGLGGAGSPQVVEYLCNAQADPNERMPEKLTEMGEGMVDMMAGFYDQGNRDVLVQWMAHYKGSTPLHEAAFKGSFSVVRALCVARADPTLTNKRGFTPADIAGQRGLHHIAAELEVHIDQQSKERKAAAKQALLVKPGPKPALPAARAAPEKAPASAGTAGWWPFQGWIASAVCCTAADEQNEVSTLVPVEVPGFAVPRGKVDLSAVSTEAGSDA